LSLRRRPITSVQEGFGKGVVLDLERSDLLVLVGGDRDELGARESKGSYNAAFSASLVDFDDMHPRLVFMEAVEHDLVLGAALVGQLDLGEADGLLGPVVAIIGRVGVFIHRTMWWWFSFSAYKKIMK
jgi:hypothetical protein